MLAGSRIAGAIATFAIANPFVAAGVIVAGTGAALCSISAGCRATVSNFVDNVIDTVGGFSVFNEKPTVPPDQALNVGGVSASGASSGDPGDDDERSKKKRNPFDMTTEEKQAIRQIDNPALPNNSTLTGVQREALRKNLENVLQNSLRQAKDPATVRNVLRTLPRFRFVDQIPGARERIATELAKFGLEP